MSNEEYYQWLVSRRIACPEVGYSYSEAMYGSVEEWIKETQHV